MSYFINVLDASTTVGTVYSVYASAHTNANTVVGRAVNAESNLSTNERFYVRPNRTPISLSSLLCAPPNLSPPQFFLSGLAWGEKKYLTYKAADNRYSPSTTTSPAASKYNVLRIAEPASGGSYRPIRRCIVSQDGTNATDDKYISMQDFDVFSFLWVFDTASIASTTTYPSGAQLLFSCNKGSGPVRGTGYFHRIRCVATGSELYARTNGAASAAMTPLSFVASSQLNNTTTSFTFIPRQVPGVDGATKYTYSIKTGAVDAAGTPLYLCMNEAEDPNDPNLRVFSIQLRPEYGVREWEEWEVVPTTIGANFGRFRLVSTAFPSQCVCCPSSAGIALAANLYSSAAVEQGYADFEIYEYSTSSASEECAAVSISSKGQAETAPEARMICCGTAARFTRHRLAAVIVSLILIVAMLVVLAFPGTAAAAMSFF